MAIDYNGEVGLWGRGKNSRWLPGFWSVQLDEWERECHSLREKIIWSWGSGEWIVLIKFDMLNLSWVCDLPVETSSRQLHMCISDSEESSGTGMNLGVMTSTAMSVNEIIQGSVSHKGSSTFQFYNNNFSTCFSSTFMISFSSIEISYPTEIVLA